MIEIREKHIATSKLEAENYRHSEEKHVQHDFYCCYPKLTLHRQSKVYSVHDFDIIHTQTHNSVDLSNISAAVVISPSL